MRTSFCCIVTINYTHIHAESYGNIITTSGHSSLEKYISHFIRKGYERVIVWESSWRLNKDCNILTPTLLAIAAFLSRSPGLFNLGLESEVNMLQLSISHVCVSGEVEPSTIFGIEEETVKENQHVIFFKTKKRRAAIFFITEWRRKNPK